MNERSPLSSDAGSPLLGDNSVAVAEFIARAQLLSPIQWQSPRAPGKWTPCHEAQHLALSYRFFTEAILERYELAPQVSPERSQTLRAVVVPKLRAGEPLPSGARSPAEADPITYAESSTRDRAAVLRDLAVAGRAFCSALAEQCIAEPRRQVRHPYFGSLTMDDFALVAAAHTRHHMSFLPTELTPEQAG